MKNKLCWIAAVGVVVMLVWVNNLTRAQSRRGVAGQDASFAGSDAASANVEERDIHLPATADNLRYLGHFANGDVLLGTIHWIDDDQRTDGLWRVGIDGEVVQKIEERTSTPELRVGYARAAVSPSGQLALHRVTEAGRQSTIDRATGERRSERNLPIHDILIWNTATNERWEHPVMGAFVWLSDDQLVFTRSEDHGQPISIYVLDCTAREVVAEVPMSGRIGGLYAVRPGVIAADLMPDPQRPKDHDVEYLGREANEQEQEPITAEATHFTADDPVRPFNHPWTGFGKLVMLDLTDMESPVERELMDVVPNGYVSAISADGALVVFRQPTRPGSQYKAHVDYTVYNTETGFWAEFPMSTKNAYWRADQSTLVTCVAGQDVEPKLVSRDLAFARGSADE